MSSASAYLVESATWALGGFLAGYLTGSFVRTTTATTEDSVPHFKRPSAQQIFGIVVLLLAVATVVQGVITTRATEHLAQCQQNYSDAFATALDARSHSTADAQASLDQLIALIGSTLHAPAADPNAVQRAIDSYLSTRREADSQRRQNPYPPPPSSLCQ